MNRFRGAKTWCMAGVAALLCGLLASCGGSTNDDAPDKAAGGVSSEDYDAEANVEALFEGTFTGPPADSPPPAKGLNVWAVSARPGSAVRGEDDGRHAGRRGRPWLGLEDL